MEGNTLFWLLVKDDIQFDFGVAAVLARGEDLMVTHFCPSWSIHRVMLHCLIQEVECRQANLDIARPAPGALLYPLV